MTLEDLYFIAQIVAALAIVGSLIFVGLQIRTGTQEQTHQRKYDNFNIQNTITKLLSREGEIADIFARGGKDFKGLSPTERVRFSNMSVLTVRSLDLVRSMRDAGDISDDDLRSFEEQVYRAFASPGGRDWWENSGIATSFSEPVREHINRVLREGDAKGLGTVMDYTGR